MELYEQAHFGAHDTELGEHLRLKTLSNRSTLLISTRPSFPQSDPMHLNGAADDLFSDFIDLLQFHHRGSVHIRVLASFSGKLVA